MDEGRGLSDIAGRGPRSCRPGLCPPDKLRSHGRNTLVCLKETLRANKGRSGDETSSPAPESGKGPRFAPGGAALGRRGCRWPHLRESAPGPCSRNRFWGECFHMLAPRRGWHGKPPRGFAPGSLAWR